ncbi:anti-repressor SinI family protein [Robertmurraya korlensis]|jgi:antagonist of SinR|nr:anti-repressor SinI family protein [Robertmurraya korlensis]
MLETHEVTVEELDYEWMLLILEAKKLGIQKDEIRKFLGENEIRG